MSRQPEIIHNHPRGWWYQDERTDNWCGPFDTPEEAQSCAVSLAPTRSTFVKLINLQLWEERKIRIPQYKKCPHCKNGFVGDRCCRKCEGTGRLEKKE